MRLPSIRSRRNVFRPVTRGSALPATPRERSTLHRRASRGPWYTHCLPLSVPHTFSPKLSIHARDAFALQGFWWQLNKSDLEYVILLPFCLLHGVGENLLRLRRAEMVCQFDGRLLPGGAAGAG